MKRADRGSGGVESLVETRRGKLNGKDSKGQGTVAECRRQGIASIEARLRPGNTCIEHSQSMEFTFRRDLDFSI
jgi:hypothetical protein